MYPFTYRRPAIGLEMTVTPIQHGDLWELEAVGVCNGQRIEYTEMWFDSPDAIRRCIENSNDAFYLSLSSYEAMETVEADSFAGLSEVNEE